ncbi:MAG: hypothetical protein KGY66_04545 [Candidatus Thermoplasmatota archaeon]|nr:hypothetical protein [Candidatus Thermoplasmatota archaeon]MBS3790167.1 hypothetical protein [Candidatus Thermoplasmatota archaeon]
MNDEGKLEALLLTITRSLLGVIFDYDASQIYFTVDVLAIPLKSDTMNKKGMIERALDEQGPEERFNKALARVMSERIDGKKGYEEYMELIDEIRDISRRKEISLEEAAKKYLD